MSYWLLAWNNGWVNSKFLRSPVPSTTVFNLSMILCVVGGMIFDGALMVVVLLGDPIQRRSTATVVCFLSNDP